jgi:hypothetical protein
MRRTGWEDASNGTATETSSWRGGVPYRSALQAAIRVTPLGTQIAALRESAGVGSGNFTFTVPIVSYPGRSESRISLSLVYNSRLW